MSTAIALTNVEAGPPVTPSGSSRPTFYRHIQASPSTTWVVVHNLGMYPGGISCRDQTGEPIEYDNLTYDSLNQFTLTYLASVMGEVDVS